MAPRGRTRVERDWGLVRVHIERIARQGASIEAVAAKYHCSWHAMKRLFEEWGLDVNTRDKADIKARDARIIAMAKEGVKDAAILKALLPDYPTLSRGAVIGVRHRNGLGKTKKKISASYRENGRRAAIANRIAFGNAPSNLPPSKKPAPQPPDMTPAPASNGGRWVALFEATGCMWIEGDVKSGTARACNAPKCQVVRVRDPAKLRFNTSYCDQHWEARRASKHTRVVAR